MINFLNQDFPFFTEYKKALRIILATSSLSFLFALIITFILVQPTPKAGSLAFIVFFMLLCGKVITRIVIPMVSENQFSEKKWTVGKELTWLVLEILLGLSSSYFLLIWIWDVPKDFYLENTIKSTRTIFLGIQLFIIPITIFIKREMVLQDYLKKATYINMVLIKNRGTTSVKKPSGTPIQLRSNDEKKNIELVLDTILFLKGADNYIEVFYLSENKVQRILLRNTLKSLFEDLKIYDNFVHCHRSHIININQVLTVNGNARGYKVLLKSYDQLIPVSRKKTVEFDNAINNLGIVI